MLNSLKTAFLNPITSSRRPWAARFHGSGASFRSLWLALLFLAASGLQAQLSGTINDYAVVTSVDFCNNLVVVNDDAGFFEGDRVILMQMQGATVDTNNSSNYGQITDIGNAGHFEILTILDISANIISFEEAMIHEYAGPGVQLITLPEYNDVSVDMTLQPLLWDGQQGGVIAMEVNGTLTLNADIDASGRGSVEEVETMTPPVPASPVINVSSQMAAEVVKVKVYLCSTTLCWARELLPTVVAEEMIPMPEVAVVPTSWPEVRVVPG